MRCAEATNGNISLAKTKFKKMENDPSIAENQSGFLVKITPLIKWCPLMGCHRRHRFFFIGLIYSTANYRQIHLYHPLLFSANISVRFFCAFQICFWWEFHAWVLCLLWNRRGFELHERSDLFSLSLISVEIYICLFLYSLPVQRI